LEGATLKSFFPFFFCSSFLAGSSNEAVASSDLTELAGLTDMTSGRAESLTKNFPGKIIYK